MTEILKLPEVARRLGVSEKTARRYVKAGDLPSVFVGNAYRVSEEDVARYLHQARVPVGGESPKALRPLTAEWALEVPEETFEREIAAADGDRLRRLLSELVGDSYTRTRKNLQADVTAARSDREAKDRERRKVEAFSRAVAVRRELLDRGEHTDEGQLPAFRKHLAALDLA